MAGNGRKAAKPRSAVVSNPSSAVADGWQFEELEPIGPELPDAAQLNLIDGVWSRFVVQSYESFRRSPQARQLRSRWEWDSLIYTFAMMDKSIKKRSFDGLGPELRQRMNQYGDTPSAKRALKMETPEANDMAASINGFVIPVLNAADFDSRADAVM